MIATGFALAGFWLAPTAPPRRRAGSGLRDTLADVHQWGWWSGPGSALTGLGGLTNAYPVMPSPPAAWALWTGCLIARHARSPLARTAGVAYPILTGPVVMGTGDHYLPDVLGR